MYRALVTELSTPSLNITQSRKISRGLATRAVRECGWQARTSAVSLTSVVHLEFKSLTKPLESEDAASVPHAHMISLQLLSTLILNHHTCPLIA
ncbi:hypothetical protein E2C01_070388 [Portunus trituberculatus]|uniref:Uncharacterized protein n=1 Tax=Portunus trituberculatus TaxID=210409 RepID=A0A5B7I3D0_PORTR|nr:hypothetical protein [Portunus trituberculatus]